ncbi:MAG: arginine--tRNA ligase, partial [Novosphingobium sp.]
MAETETLYTSFARRIGTALDALEVAGTLPAGLHRTAITLEPPRDPAHGDLATNAAMVLAKPAGTNPRQLAEAIVAELAKLPEVESAAIAGPGFINLRLAPEVWLGELRAIAALGGDYGRSTAGGGSTVNIEYVSANPTGPMHMGHCRGAVVGDALASLLEFAGHKVIREYYVNDAGAQVDVLADSVFLRYSEALGIDIGEIPPGLYPGDYLKPIGAALAAEFGDRFLGEDNPDKWRPLFRKRAVAAMMEMIRADLALLGI